MKLGFWIHCSLLLSSHIAPHRREVKVQLLEPRPLQTSSQDEVGVVGVQTEVGLLSGFPGDDTNKAAALIKVNLTPGQLTASIQDIW